MRDVRQQHRLSYITFTSRLSVHSNALNVSIKAYTYHKDIYIYVHSHAQRERERGEMERWGGGGREGDRETERRTETDKFVKHISTKHIWAGLFNADKKQNLQLLHNKIT